MELLMLIVSFIIGVCTGSFVNMLTFRTAIKYGLLKRKKIDRSDLGGRSYCDWCGRQLIWFENIPVLSWIFLNGKGKCCGKKLPLLYPVVELGSGLLFVLWAKIGLDSLPIFSIIIGFFILVFLIFSTVFDAKYMILPDFSTAALFLLTILFIVSGKELSQLPGHLLAMIIGFGFMWFLFWITKGRGMGFGDVKFAGFMGLFLGLSEMIIAMYVAFIGGAVFGLGLMVLFKAGRKTKMPFGPFLILGTIVAWWYAKLR